MSNYSAYVFHDNVAENTSWQKLMAYIEPKSTVLDIGCSSGNFGAELIERKGCVVDGVEIDPEDAKLAGTKLREVTTFNIENGVPSELANHQYDYVCYVDVIEHLANPVKALKYTKDLLKPGGKLLFSLPNMSHISVRVAAIMGKFGYGEVGLLDKTHLHFYDLKEVERIFAEAGYKVTKTDFIFVDVPEKILTDQLATVGLTPNQKFFDVARQTENVTYEFCGVAEPLAEGETNVPLKLPDAFPATDEMDKLVKELQRLHAEDIGRVKAHYERLLNGIDDEELADYRSFRASKFRRAWEAYKKLAAHKPGKGKS